MGILKDYGLNRWKIPLFYHCHSFGSAIPKAVHIPVDSKNCSKFLAALTSTELVIIIPGNKKGLSNATRRQT